MTKLTGTQKKKIATAARKMAIEYLDGRGAMITNGHGYRFCLAGELVTRAGLGRPVSRSTPPIEIDSRGIAGHLDRIVDMTPTDATAYYDYVRSWSRRPDTCPGHSMAPVIPLLWLADELDGIYHAVP